MFDLIRRTRHGGDAVLCAFDLIELDGENLRRTPIEQRKEKLSRLVRGRHPGIVYNAHYIVDGGIVFKNACALGCEGIVFKAAWLNLSPSEVLLHCLCCHCSMSLIEANRTFR